MGAEIHNRVDEMYRECRAIFPGLMKEAVVVVARVGVLRLHQASVDVGADDQPFVSSDGGSECAALSTFLSCGSNRPLFCQVPRHTVLLARLLYMPCLALPYEQS